MNTPHATSYQEAPLPRHIQVQIDQEIAFSQGSYGLPLTPDDAPAPSAISSEVSALDSIFAESSPPAPVQTILTQDTGVDLFAPAPTPAAPTAPAPSAEIAALLSEFREFKQSMTQPAPVAQTPSALGPISAPVFDAAALGVPPEVQEQFRTTMHSYVAPLVEHANNLAKTIAEQNARHEQAVSSQSRRIFEDALSRTHNDFPALHKDAGFAAHLDQPVNQYTPEITIKAAYTKAWNEGNISLVSKILGDYKQTKQAIAPVTETFRAPHTQVSTAAAQMAAASPHQRLVSTSAYDKVVDAYSRGKIGQMEFDKVQAAFDLAARENRLTN